MSAALTRLGTAAAAVDGKISTAIAALDADVDASGTAQHSGTFVVSGITEVDGIITAVDSVEVEAAGAAAAAVAALVEIGFISQVVQRSINHRGRIDFFHVQHAAIRRKAVVGRFIRVLDFQGRCFALLIFAVAINTVRADNRKK